MQKKNIGIKLLKIAAGILFLIIAYLFWEESIYTWLCEEESNAPSCHVAGLINEKNDFQSKADDYFKMACELGYEISCNKIKGN